MIRPFLARFASTTRFKVKPRLMPTKPQAVKPPPGSIHAPLPKVPQSSIPTPRQIPLVSLSQFTVINIAVLLFTHLFTTHVYTINGTWGASMLPTMYLSGEYVLIQRWNRRGRGVVVGDVVCARHPTNPAETVIKRIIGMPGDFVGSGEVDGGGNIIQVCSSLSQLATLYRKFVDMMNRYPQAIASFPGTTRTFPEILDTTVPSLWHS
jgi:hypothetical protein